MRHNLVLVSLAAAALAATAPTGAADPTRSCADLGSYSAGDVRVQSAEEVAAGAQPAHCRVLGVIEKEMNFELLLPEEWNGRFVMGGGGGFVGSIQNQAQTPNPAGGTALEQGYATVGTDTGHQDVGIEADWALDNEERERNFGYRAVHLTAETAKKMIAAHYGRAPERSYFIGCSRGGGQAMVESQRYPADFDGIVAGAPAYDWPGIGAAFVRNQQAIYPDGPNEPPVITTENRSLLERQVEKRCDELDGVDDGIVDDPRRCDFDPAALPRCAGDEGGPDCLTERQLAAIETVYGGARRGYQLLYPGFPFGDEAAPQGGWGTWITGAPNALGPGRPSLHYAFGTEMYKYLVFDDPEWDYRSYDFADWERQTAKADTILSAKDPDLDDLAEDGGKMIWFQGWSDPAISAFGTIRYYEQLLDHDSEATDYARLFLMPGVLHCAGGDGPDTVDWIGTIADWVEKGEAPDRVTASKFAGSDPVLSRPLCPYPQVAIWDGEGPTEEASSFRCGNR